LLLPPHAFADYSGEELTRTTGTLAGILSALTVPDPAPFYMISLYNPMGHLGLVIVPLCRPDHAQDVKQLDLAWYADLDTSRGQEATPLVIDGVLYVSTAWSMYPHA
jgi:hypothetical protein